MNNHRFSVSGSTLKIIAIISMLIDHTGAAIIRPLRTALPDTMQQTKNFLTWIYPLSRNIGRLAFPIFCFLLVEGFFHTRNVYKYAGRLFLFALISELPFDYALGKSLFDFHHQNVYFTLLFALLALIALSEIEQLKPRCFHQRIFCRLLQIIACVFPLIIAQRCYFDYRFRGIMVIFVLYGFHQNRKEQAAMGALTISWETWGPFAFLPIWFYNGKRGLSLKYLFYWFYPVHLIVLGFLRHMVLSMS